MGRMAVAAVVAYQVRARRRPEGHFFALDAQSPRLDAYLYGDQRHINEDEDHDDETHYPALIGMPNPLLERRHVH
jgi:hypothetical protein